MDAMPQLRDLDESIRKRGGRLTLTTGPVPTGKYKADGTLKYANGVTNYSEREIMLNVSSLLDPMKNGWHEDLHLRIYTDVQSAKAVALFKRMLTEDHVKTIREAYNTEDGPYTPVFGAFSTMNRGKYLEEFACDLAGNYNRAKLGNAEFSRLRDSLLDMLDLVAPEESPLNGLGKERSEEQRAFSVDEEEYGSTLYDALDILANDADQYVADEDWEARPDEGRSEELIGNYLFDPTDSETFLSSLPEELKEIGKQYDAAWDAGLDLPAPSVEALKTLGVDKYKELFKAYTKLHLMEERSFIGTPRLSYDDKIARNTLNNNRSGFTPTDTPEFKQYWHDDTGDLTYRDEPLVMVRGAHDYGPTVLHDYSDGAKSGGGIWTAEVPWVAELYANSKNNTRSKVIGKNGNGAFEQNYGEGWDGMRAYVSKYFYNHAAGVGYALEKDGDSYVMRSNILGKEVAEGKTAAEIKTDWKERATYPATEEGLKQFQHDLGGFIKEDDMEISGVKKVYGSAKKTLVLDCKGAPQGQIQKQDVPKELWNTGVEEFSDLPTFDDSIIAGNQVVRNAFAAGYDHVVFRNVFDAGGVQTQHAFKSRMQVRDVYNRGSWGTTGDPDMMFSVANESEADFDEKAFVQEQIEKEAAVIDSFGWDFVYGLNEKAFVEGEPNANTAAAAYALINAWSDSKSASSYDLVTLLDYVNGYEKATKTGAWAEENEPTTGLEEAGIENEFDVHESVEYISDEDWDTIAQKASLSESAAKHVDLAIDEKGWKAALAEFMKQVEQGVLPTEEKLAMAMAFDGAWAKNAEATIKDLNEIQAIISEATADLNYYDSFDDDSPTGYNAPDFNDSGDTSFDDEYDEGHELSAEDIIKPSWGVVNKYADTNYAKAINWDGWATLYQEHADNFNSGELDEESYYVAKALVNNFPANMPDDLKGLRDQVWNYITAYQNAEQKKSYGAAAQQKRNEVVEKAKAEAERLGYSQKDIDVVQYINGVFEVFATNPSTGVVKSIAKYAGDYTGSRASGRRTAQTSLLSGAYADLKNYNGDYMDPSTGVLYGNEQDIEDDARQEARRKGWDPETVRVQKNDFGKLVAYAKDEMGREKIVALGDNSYDIDDRSQSEIDLNTDREGFTPTDTPEFDAFFNDPTGELTFAPGMPKVLVHGDMRAGKPDFADAAIAHTKAIYLADEVNAAASYGSKTNVPVKYSHTWEDANDYLKIFKRYDLQLRLDQDEDGVYHLVEVADGDPDYVEAEYGQFAPTEDGLEEFNRKIGRVLNGEHYLHSGRSLYYGTSILGTALVNAYGAGYSDMPVAGLPADLIRAYAKEQGISQRAALKRTLDTDSAAKLAFDTGKYDLVVMRYVGDNGGYHTQYAFKTSNQVKSVHNRGSWDIRERLSAFSIEEEDAKTGGAFSELLKSLETQYGEGSSEKMFEMFKGLKASQMAAASAAIRSYGTLPSGENAARPAPIPAKMDKDTKVSLTARTVAEAKSTTTERLPQITDAVLDNKFSYTEKRNKVQVNKARYRIRQEGWSDVLSDWTVEARRGHSSPELTALGAVLLEEADNGGASGNEYVNLLKDYADMLRNAGQAVQAARVLKNLTPSGRLYLLQREVARINQLDAVKNALPEGMTLDVDLVDQYRKAKSDAERDVIIDRMLKKIAEQMPVSNKDRFTALRYLNMLGNAKTQVRNVVGNAAFQPVRMAKDSVKAFMETVASAVGVNIERTAAFTADPETYKACAVDFEHYKGEIMNGGKFADADKYSRQIEENRQIFGKTKWGAWNKTGGKVLEKYRKATNWAMDEGDVLFCRFTYADAMAKYLKANKTTFQDASTELLDKARTYAMKQAAEATYRDNNAFSQAISAMRFRNPNTWAKKGINFLGEGLMPFRKTPANILVRAVEYSPVGLLTAGIGAGVDVKNDGKVDGVKLMDNLAKAITGTGLVLLGVALFNKGLLKGGSPEDDKDEAFNTLTGHQDYAIELPNGLSITLDWLAPECIPLFLGANLAADALEDGFTFKDVLTAAGRITDPLLSMSMLQGVNDALSNASTYGDDSALVRFAGNALWSYSTQYLTNTLIGQFERSLTNQRMTTFTDKNKQLPAGIQRLLGQSSAKVLGWDYNQIPYIDAWGRAEQNAKTGFGNVLNQFINPAYVSWVDESDVEKELRRLREATGDTGVFPQRAKASFTVNGEKIDLTAEQYLDYAVTKGSTAYEILADLVSSSEYAGMDDAQKAAAISRVYTFADQVGKAQATGWDLSGEMPDNAYEPNAWVLKAKDATDKGVSVATYVAAYERTSGIESIKDSSGKTITYSKALQQMKEIYDMNLPASQTKALFEALGISEKLWDYDRALVDSKLREMQRQ